MDSVSKDWELPELTTQPSETEPFELNLDELFEIECYRKRQETGLIIRIATPGEKLKNNFIGTLTIEQRKEKVKKYLEKRKKRTWQKKIYYDCRKRVADNRLRIKGRFVTRDQAIYIYGPEYEALQHLL